MKNTISIVRNLLKSNMEQLKYKKPVIEANFQKKVFQLKEETKKHLNNISSNTYKK